MSGLTPQQLEAVTGISRGLKPNAISKAIGVSERSVQRWLKLPEFQEALNQLRSKTRSKIIEKASEENAEKFSVNLGKIQEEHLKSYVRMRQIAEKGLEHYKKKMEESPEDCNIRNLNLFSQVIDRCLKGEAESAFLRNLDLDTAMRCVFAAGYEIHDPSRVPTAKVTEADLN
jgi:hypothetical protein